MHSSSVRTISAHHHSLYEWADELIELCLLWMNRSWEARAPRLEETVWYNWRDCSRAVISPPGLKVASCSSWSQGQQHSPGQRHEPQDFRFWNGQDVWRGSKPIQHESCGWNIVCVIQNIPQNISNIATVMISWFPFCSGYMSPEYAMEGVFSVKSDIYSFGVLMLEIITGKRALSFHGQQDSLNIAGFVSTSLSPLYTELILIFCFF